MSQDPQYQPQYPTYPPQQGQYPAYPPQQGQYPGYAPPPGYAPAPPTNTMAILALVFAFVFSPLGIVFGIMGRKQIRETGESGHGLATAGLVVGAVFTGLIVLMVVLYIILLAAVFGAVSELGELPQPPG